MNRIFFQYLTIFYLKNFFLSFQECEEDKEFLTNYIKYSSKSLTNELTKSNHYFFCF